MVKALTIRCWGGTLASFFRNSHHTSLKLTNASMIWPPAPTMCALSVTAKSVSWRFTTASFLSSRLLCSALMDWKNAFFLWIMIFYSFSTDSKLISCVPSEVSPSMRLRDFPYAKVIFSSFICSIHFIFCCPVWIFDLLVLPLWRI